MNPNLARTLAFRKSMDESQGYAEALERKDGNNCTVKALQLLTGASYKAAYDAVKALGRRRGRGLSVWLDREYVELFRTFGCTVTQVTWTEPQGSYLILTDRHACAFVGGRPLNGLDRKNRVLGIWKVDRD